MQQYADIYLMKSDFTVNKYLHTVASGRISIIIFFNVLLTVHLSIILVINQLNAQILFS